MCCSEGDCSGHRLAGGGNMRIELLVWRWSITVSTMFLSILHICQYVSMYPACLPVIKAGP